MLNSKNLVSLIAKRFPDAVFFKEVEEQSKVIALTIDDIPAKDDSDISTQQILEVIDQHNQEFNANFKATFFVTTDHLQNSTIVETIDEKGYEIGNHGTKAGSHNHFFLQPHEFEKEFAQAHEILAEKVTQPIQWFRPAQALYNCRMIKTLRTLGRDLGYRDKFALASMLPFDTNDFLNNPNFTLKYINKFIFSGSILVLHGGEKNQALNTVEVLKKLLPRLQEEDYQLVTLAQLFEKEVDD